VTAIAPTPKGHGVKPPPGPAEPPARTTPTELTDEQRGYLKDRPQQPWTHVEPGCTSGP
jgi:cell division protein FtsN